MICEKVPRLIHCFGNENNHIDVEMVKEMIINSKNTIIPINTHNIDSINDWEELPIGYGEANWRKLSQILDVSKDIPVWNINLQTTSDEVIRRTRRAVELGGKRAVKLEVLNPEHTISINDKVVRATQILMEEDGLEVWPLVMPSFETVDRLLALGCPMIRVIGSDIGSGEGISSKAIEVLHYIKNKNKNTLVMLDGGVGSKFDVYKALINGFDSVLVNSYLYKTGHSPAEELKDIVEVL